MLHVYIPIAALSAGAFVAFQFTDRLLPSARQITKKQALLAVSRLTTAELTQLEIDDQIRDQYSRSVAL